MASSFSAKHRSFWLEQALAQTETPSSGLMGDHKSDLLIVGGGFVGLWTAIQIKKMDPACEVLLIEQDICGGGASGRSGGFVLSWWPKLTSLIKICGEEDALRIVRDSENAIHDISDFCKTNAIDAGMRSMPWLWGSTAIAHDDAWRGVVDSARRLGENPFQEVSADEARRRSGSMAFRGGVIDTSAATVQPAKLARGLMRVALELGVRIYENTRLVSFSRSQPVVAKLEHGSIRAEKMILATNAWAAQLPELARSIIPITSDMIMTAPAPDEIKACGMARDLCFTDSQTMVNYYHPTDDGRIAFGKGGWGIAWKGNIGANFERNRVRAQSVEGDFRLYYPGFKNIAITHDWCGPIDRTPNSLPLIGHFKNHPNIHYGIGWSGNGIGPSHLGGKILASVALAKVNHWSQYPILNRSVGRFPPEPVRFLGAHVVRTAVASKERDELNGNKPSFIASALARLAPAGLEDKSQKVPIPFPAGK